MDEKNGQSQKKVCISNLVDKINENQFQGENLLKFDLDIP